MSGTELVNVLIMHDCTINTGNENSCPTKITHMNIFNEDDYNKPLAQTLRITVASENVH